MLYLAGDHSRQLFSFKLEPVLESTLTKAVLGKHFMVRVKGRIKFVVAYVNDVGFNSGFFNLPESSVYTFDTTKPSNTKSGMLDIANAEQERKIPVLAPPLNAFSLARPKRSWSHSDTPRQTLTGFTWCHSLLWNASCWAELYFTHPFSEKNLFSFPTLLFFHIPIWLFYIIFSEWQISIGSVFSIPIIFFFCLLACHRLHISLLALYFLCCCTIHYTWVASSMM